MIPGFAKDDISIGSAPDNDVVLGGAGVAPHHARIIKRDGALYFVDGGQSRSLANNVDVDPFRAVPFESIGSPTPIRGAKPGTAEDRRKAGAGHRGRTTAPRGKPTFLVTGPPSVPSS